MASEFHGFLVISWSVPAKALKKAFLLRHTPDRNSLTIESMDETADPSHITPMEQDPNHSFWLLTSALRMFMKSHSNGTSQSQAGRRIFAESKCDPWKGRDGIWFVPFGVLVLKGGGFWSALGFFWHCSGRLPISTELPDMTSDTESYMRLQEVYQKKSADDVTHVASFAKRIAMDRGLEAPSETAVKHFCHHAAYLRVIRYDIPVPCTEEKDSNNRAHHTA